MKNLLKFATLLVVCLFVAFSFSSCDKDVCYECSDGTTTEELCEGDDGASEDDVETAVALLEAFGYECDKQ